MPSKRHHILNGDSLKKLFPDSLEGETIVIRECMIVGSTEGRDFEEIMKNRFLFLKDAYQVTEKEHLKKSISSFQKILQINKNDEVILWFEHDLFCQANLWFILFLIHQNTSLTSVAFVSPPHKHRYGFHAITQEELVVCFNNRKTLNKSDIEKFSELWIHYQSGNKEQLKAARMGFEKKFLYVVEAIDAHLQRNINSSELGRPERTLIRLSQDLNTSDIEIIFEHFKKEEAIYGLGDSQVKSLFNKLIEDGLIKK